MWASFRLYRRNGLINIFNSITWDIVNKEIVILTDNGRLIKPLYVIEDNDFLIQPKHIEDINDNKLTFTDLLTGFSKRFDIYANVYGGGSTGQAGAIRLAIARNIEKVDPDLRSDLKKAGMLTRDSRRVERKKYGQPGARKRFQFSKR